MTARRVEHCRVLDSVWTQAALGRPQLSMVVGEAGAGKSWLTQHWRAARPPAEAPRIWTLRRPDWVMELLERGEPWLRDERDALFLGAARHLAPQLAWSALAGGATPPMSSAQALGSVFAAVQRLAQRLGGLCLILEDLHEWDRAALDALGTLWRRALISGTPLLLLPTTRPELDAGWQASLPGAALGTTDGPAEPGVSTLTVGALNVTETAALCADLLPGAALPPELPGWVHGCAGGHALYSAQLVRYLQDSGALRQAGPVWLLERTTDLALPPDLLHLMRANLAPVQGDPAAWAVAGALAVWEGGATVGELSVALGTPQEKLREELSAGVMRGHIVAQPGGSGTRYALGHPLLPELVRSLLPGSQRRHLHARVAGVTRDPDRRARHARLGGHLQATAWTQAALDAAAARYDWAQVEAHARALLDADPDSLPQDADPANGALRLTLAQAVYAQGRAREAEPLLARLESPRARVLRAQILRAQGRPHEALAALSEDVPAGADPQTELLRAGLLTETAEPEAARAVLEGLLTRALDLPSRAAVLGDLGRLAYETQDFEGARQLNVQAADLLDEAHHPEQLSLCLNRVGMLSIQVGRWPEAEAALLRSVALLERAGSSAWLSARYNNLGLLYLQLGRYEDARVATQHALRLAEIAGERSVEIDALHNLSNAQFELGLGDDSLRALSRAMTRSREAGREAHAAGLEVYLADREARLGCPERGLTLLAGPAMLVADMYVGAARILLCSGQPRAAWDWLERGGRSNAGGEANALLLRGLCALLLERHDAADWIERAGVACADGSNPHKLAEVALLRALSAGTPDAAEAGSEALTTLAQAPGHLLIYERTVPQALAALRSRTTVPASAPAPTPSRLRTLGAFGLEEAGGLRPWRARTVRQLLALLLAAALDERGPFVSGAELRATLWPDVSDERAEESLRTTLRRLRQALGDAAQVRARAGQYALELRRADILLFLRALDGADLGAATAAYRGDFLPQVDHPRVNALREQLRARWRGAAAELALQVPVTRATQLYEQLLADDPLDLETHVAYLNDLKRRAEPGRLRAALEAATATFERELGEAPPELRDWGRVLVRARSPEGQQGPVQNKHNETE